MAEYKKQGFQEKLPETCVYQCFGQILMNTLYGEGQCGIIFLVADWRGRGYGIDFFEKSWEIRIPSRIFENTRPRNEPGKTKPGLPGTQDDGRSSRNTLE